MRNTAYHDVWMIEKFGLGPAFIAVDTESLEINSCDDLVSSTWHKEAPLIENSVMTGLNWNLK
jgi:hypothetical protein